MQLSKFSDYSFRILIHLGQHRDRLCTVDEIAQRFDISHNHLKKAVHQLAKEGFIVSVKGRNGGIRLATEPVDINLGAVLRKTEENFHIAECFSCADKCVLSANCKLTGIMHRALLMFLKEFDQKTLADILS